MKLPILSNFFKSKETDYYITVDLGSLEIKTAIFKKGTEFEGLKILGIGTQPQGLSCMRGGRVLDLDAVAESLQLALEEVHLKAGVTPTQLQLILGLSPDVICATGLRVRTHRSQPEKQIDQAEFEVLATQVEEKTLTRAKKELEEKYQCELKRVETRFTAYLLDGAKVKTPLGLSGSELEIIVLHYFIEPSRLSAINSLVEQVGLEIVSLVDTTVNLAASCLETHQNFILIDVGGDATEMVLVKAGKLVSSEILYMGGKDFTRQIQNDLNLTFKDAESLKKEYSRGHLDHERARTIKKSLEEVVEWWGEGVAAMLKVLSSRDFPSLIFVAGQSRHLNEIRSSLVSYPWNKNFNFVGFPKVEIMQGKYPGLNALTKIEL